MREGRTPESGSPPIDAQSGLDSKMGPPPRQHLRHNIGEAADDSVVANYSRFPEGGRRGAHSPASDSAVTTNRQREGNAADTITLR